MFLVQYILLLPPIENSLKTKTYENNKFDLLLMQR